MRSRSTDGHEDLVMTRTRTPSERSAAVATTVVSSRSADESRLIDDAAPVTIRQSLLGVTAVRRATTVLDGTSKLQNVTCSP